MQLERVVGTSRTYAEKLLSLIEKSKTVGWPGLLNALSIRHVGRRVATILTQKFGSMDALRKAEVDEIAAALRVSRTENEPGGTDAKLKKKGNEPKIIAKGVYSFLHSKIGSQTIEARSGRRR